MPILDIELVGSLPGPSGPLVGLLAEHCGQVLQSRPGGTWVRLRELACDHYAENGPPQTPVFVQVWLADWPDQEVLARQARELAIAIATLLERESGQVHVLFEPAARGRIAFGGELVR